MVCVCMMCVCMMCVYDSTYDECFWLRMVCVHVRRLARKGAGVYVLCVCMMCVCMMCVCVCRVEWLGGCLVYAQVCVCIYRCMREGERERERLRLPHPCSGSCLYVSVYERE
jgi:hypothetical protein